MKLSMWRLSYAVTLFIPSASNVLAFDTCIYVDVSGEVLRMDMQAGRAEVTKEDGSLVECRVVPAFTTGAASSGTCGDLPEMVFQVFTGASNPDLEDDDLLVFRNQIWYRKCAFVR